MRIEHPLVSVVTPCLNAERYIERCILSVRSQNYPNLEHIIVDGKSNDSTISILKKYERTYNMHWISEEDKNSTDAMNKGMRLARGEMMSMLGSDDFYLPWAVETAVDSFMDDASVDLVYGDFIQVPFGKRYGSIYFNPPQSELGSHLRFNSIGALTVFYRRKVFEGLNGLDESLLIANDYDFWCKAFQRFRFAKIDEVLGCFRYRKESLSMGDSVSRNREDALVRSRYFGSSSKSYIEEFGYYSRRVFSIIERLVDLLPKSERDTRNRPWRNLLRTRGISRIHLVREIFFSPIVSTNNRLERRINHGYIDIERLIELSVSGDRGSS